MEKEQTPGGGMTLRKKLVFFTIVFLPANILSVVTFVSFRNFWGDVGLFSYLISAFLFVVPILLLAWLFNSYKKGRTTSITFATIFNFTFASIIGLLFIWWILSEILPS